MGYNRENGENPLRSRRCDPALFLFEKGTLLAIVCHCLIIGMGRLLKGRGSQKTCLLEKLDNRLPAEGEMCRQRIKNGIPEPFKDSGFFFN